MKTINIISGGTISHIRPHLALCAPAYGNTGMKISNMLRERWKNLGNSDCAEHIRLYQTKMATGGYDGVQREKLETNQDVSDLIDRLVADENTGVIFMPVALCDFEVFHIDEGPRYDGGLNIGKEFSRLKTAHGQRTLLMRPAPKLLSKIRKDRKDIFLVAFKTTSGATDDEMFESGMTLLKENSCNLVLVNDTHRKQNMILTPEMARYCITTDREKALRELVSMTESRSGLSFNRTKVEAGNKMELSSPFFPASLRAVLNYCAETGAYKPFNGVTVGHFGFKDKNIAGHWMWSSCRKKNFNKIKDRALVLVKVEDTVTAYGDKPSAGATSQYRLFKDHPEYDCVIHFHCPMKENSKLNVKPQKHYECGSIECGINTSSGLIHYANGIGAVMLDKHGPNIMFDRNIDPNIVIAFIEDNFDLSKSTSE